MSQLLARFLDRDRRLRLGRVEGDRVQPLVGDLFADLRPEGAATLPLSEVTLLAPVHPSKVVGVGSNYRDHAREMGKEVPDVPRLFLKPSTAVVGPGQPIEIPPGTTRVDHEAELGVVIGRTMRRVRREDALAYVLGYTCLNDVTARDFQRADVQFTRGKGFDTFCPLGPWIATGPDPADLPVRCRVDGQLRQDGSTRDMVFDVPTLLAFISQIMTLLPGDVIATGTPAGVGALAAGQVVEVEIGGVGALANPVVNREDRDDP